MADLRAAGWDGPIFEVSALTGNGCEALMWAIYEWLKNTHETDDDDAVDA